MFDKGLCPLVFFRQRLDCGSFGPQCRREVTWLGFGYNRRRHRIYNPPSAFLISCHSLSPQSNKKQNQPWFLAPQISHSRTAFASPVDSRRRFPQSVQKIKDPIADMLDIYQTQPELKHLGKQKRLFNACTSRDKKSAGEIFCCRKALSPPSASAGR